MFQLLFKSLETNKMKNEGGNVHDNVCTLYTRKRKRTRMILIFSILNFHMSYILAIQLNIARKKDRNLHLNWFQTTVKNRFYCFEL